MPKVTYLKTKLIIASLFYALGLIRIINWIIFWNQNEELALKNHQSFISRYIDRFPNFIKPVFSARPEPAAIISVILFSIAGLILWKQKNMILKIFSVTAFLFAFWNLFSLM